MTNKELKILEQNSKIALVDKNLKIVKTTEKFRKELNSIITVDENKLKLKSIFRQITIDSLINDFELINETNLYYDELKKCHMPMMNYVFSQNFSIIHSEAKFSSNELGFCKVLTLKNEYDFSLNIAMPYFIIFKVQNKLFKNEAIISDKFSARKAYYKFKRLKDSLSRE